jgi:hypothetical protein
VNRASLACGPMVKWAIAQLNYADMLKRVEPLRMELKSLEQAAAVKQKEADEMAATITRCKFYDAFFGRIFLYQTLKIKFYGYFFVA